MEPSASRTTRSDTDVITSFTSFLQDWMVRQRDNLDDLLAATGDGECHSDIISRILSHYHQYYNQKSMVANQNVLLLFSAPWLTSLEHAFLWVTGFRPSLAIQLGMRAVLDLSEDQVAEMESLAARTRLEEKTLNDEMARVQESVAGPALLGVARRCGMLPKNGEVDEAEDAVESIKAGMKAVVARADMLRATTSFKVVEILNPVQTVKFLAAATRLQLEIHRSGMERVVRGG